MSINTLYENSCGKGPQLLIILDNFGNKFGAYSNQSFQTNTGFFGNGDW